MKKDYRNSRARFIKEYANFKIAVLDERRIEIPANSKQNGEILAAVDEINYIVNRAYNGFITVDEAMRVISETGNEYMTV